MKHLTPGDRIKILEMYNACSQATQSPGAMLTPYGMLLKVKNSVYVFDYDDDGNMYTLSIEKQQVRLKKIEEMLTKNAPPSKTT